MRSLLVYPTHQNCREAERQYVEAGVDVATYPARQTESSEEQSQNCWNTDANYAESIGLPVVKTICPGCSYWNQCTAAGYLRQLMVAKGATVSICTQKRVEASGFTDLCTNRKFVSIHENPISLIRPGTDINEADLRLILGILTRLLNEPKFLDWFGDAMRFDADGNRYHDEELAIRKQRQYDFCIGLADLVEDLLTVIETTQSSIPWYAKDCRPLPEGIERTLLFATRVANVRFWGQPWRFVLAAAAGDLNSSAVLVAKRFLKGGITDLRKTVVGFRKNEPPYRAVVWFNDATITVDTLQAAVGKPVHDWTPDGRLPLQKKAVQILRDVTRRKTIRIVANIVRGVLADRPQFRRVGLICHRPHVGIVDALGAEFTPRVVKTAYFGSGEERSSNSWHAVCDLILVCGTPRVPPDAIAAYLLQIGDVAAACREPDWIPIRWEGHTESGEPITVPTKGYADEAWRRAQRDLVRASLVQAIGRGRGILENGCEVIVLTNEECGLRISDAGLEPLCGTSGKVLDCLKRLTTGNPIYLSIGKPVVSTPQIAEAASLSVTRVRDLLRDLERRGLVCKVGERGGWMLTDLALQEPSPSPVQDARQL